MYKVNHHGELFSCANTDSGRVPSRESDSIVPDILYVYEVGDLPVTGSAVHNLPLHRSWNSIYFFTHPIFFDHHVAHDGDLFNVDKSMVKKINT